MKPGDQRGAIYQKHIDGKLAAVSFITVGELLFGAQKRKWGKSKVADLNAKLRSLVIVPYDMAVCRTYGDLKAKLQKDGIGIADNDLWIASCAVRHSIPLISNNRKHFERIKDLVLISEAPLIREIESQGVIDLGDPTAPEPPSSQ
jgi:predicted nucleic acid-binding protein